MCLRKLVSFVMPFKLNYKKKKRSNKIYQKRGENWTMCIDMNCMCFIVCTIRITGNVSVYISYLFLQSAWILHRILFKRINNNNEIIIINMFGFLHFFFSAFCFCFDVFALFSVCCIVKCCYVHYFELDNV